MVCLISLNLSHGRIKLDYCQWKDPIMCFALRWSVHDVKGVGWCLCGMALPADDRFSLAGKPLWTWMGEPQDISWKLAGEELRAFMFIKPLPCQPTDAFCSLYWLFQLKAFAPFIYISLMQKCHLGTNPDMAFNLWDGCLQVCLDSYYPTDSEWL